MAVRQISTHQADEVAINALHEGVPAWMRGSLDDWIRPQLTRRASYLLPNMERIRDIERFLRIELVASGQSKQAVVAVMTKASQDAELKLDIVDAILRTAPFPFEDSKALGKILNQSGSKWKVAIEGINYRLEDRVDETTGKALQAMAEEKNGVSSFMVTAWNEIFGRNPNPSLAYSNAVKAVEAASWKLVTPNDSKSTLGSITKKLRENPSHFAVAINEKRANEGVDSVEKEMKLLWDGQSDRHGTSNPVSPTQKAAEQAVIMALSICQQFVRGHITKAGDN